MKTIYFSGIIAGIILLTASAALAITAGTIPTSDEIGIKAIGVDPNPTGIVGLLVTVVKWTYTVFFIAAAFFILLAAFKYLTGGHNPANVQMAHKMILYAAIAIVVAFMSVGFETIIQNLIAPNSSSSTTINTNTATNNDPYNYGSR